MNPELEALRDIRLPDPVSWWPPAPGWWLLLTLSGVAIWLWCRRPSQRLVPYRRRMLREARSELAQLRRSYRHHEDPARLARELSIWLRRVVIGVYPRERVAGVTGEEWLRLLDRPLGGNRFCTALGRVLVTAPYRRAVRADGEALLDLSEEWLLALLRSPEAERAGV